MKTNRYILASCKPWHKHEVEELQQGAEQRWDWAGSPEELEEILNDSIPRYIFFLHWNWLVPEKICTEYECVCFHMTDVPYGRGGSPLQNLIVAGHKDTQLTALRMVGELDAGPVYCKKPMSLAGRAEDIYKRATKLSVEIIKWMILHEPVPSPQVGSPVFFKRRSPDQSALPQGTDLDALFDHIRMLDAPTYPKAFIDHGEFRLEFSDAEFDNSELKANVIFRKRQ